MTPLQAALAYVLGGTVRDLLVGIGTFVVAVPLAGLPAAHSLLVAVAALAAGVVHA